MKTIINLCTMLSVVFLVQANPTEKLYENSLPDPPKIVLNELFSLEKMIGEILNREDKYYISGTLSRVFEAGTGSDKFSTSSEVILSSEINAYYGRNYVEAYGRTHHVSRSRYKSKVIQIYIHGDTQRSGDIDKTNVKINVKYKDPVTKSNIEISGKLSHVTTVRGKESFFISGILRKQGITLGVNLIVSKFAFGYIRS